MRQLPICVCVALFVICAPADAQDIAQLVKTGDQHLDQYRYTEAYAQYSTIPETATDDQLLSKYTGLAMSLMGIDRFTDETRRHTERALEIARKIGTDKALVRAENVRGQFLDGTRTGDRGISMYLHAAGLAERTGAKQALATIYHNLARVYQSMEDWERSMYYAQRAFELESNPSLSSRFNYHIARGIGFFELYERDAAEQEYQTALELSEQTKRPRDRGLTLSELAFLYWTFDKDKDRAIRLYTEAIEYSHLAKVVSNEANSYANRGNVYRDTGDYDRAEQDYRQAIRMLEANGRSSGPFFVWKNIGQVMRLRGQTHEAVALLTQLIDERGPAANLRHLWQAHMELASALSTLGDRAAAARHFEQMIDILEEQRKSAILDSFRSGTFAHALSTYDPYDRYIRFLLEEGKIADALGVSERARARGFLEALASVRGAVAAKLPPALLDEDSQISHAISAAQQQLRAPSLDKTQRDAALRALARAEESREQFILRMRVEQPALADARYPALLGASQIQSALRERETAVAFFLSEPASFRWTLTRQTIRADRIAPRSQIERDASALRDLLRAPSSRTELDAVTRRLSASLLSGLDLSGDPSASVGAPLTIIPHGVLHYIPFEVLRAGDGVIVERHAVSYAPSLNALMQLRRAPASAAPFRVLAVGNPLGSSRAQDTPVTRSGDGDALENLALLQPLPYAEQELHAIGRTFPDRTRILSGNAARETDLRSSFTANFPVIHFATHGLVSDVQPKRSGLLMSPEDGEDGLLQTSEIYGLGLKANLIVLSACQTALGKEITGEGLVGLSRAFFYAGARSVVATLWNLNDRFAAEFVERFYRELNSGASAEESLRRAKAAYVNHPQYSHPFYWSSLVLLGDGTQPLVAEPVQRSHMPGVLGTVLAGLAALITAVRVRNSA